MNAKRHFFFTDLVAVVRPGIGPGSIAPESNALQTVFYRGRFSWFWRE